MVNEHTQPLVRRILEKTVNNEVKSSIKIMGQELARLKTYLVNCDEEAEKCFPITEKSHLASIDKYLERDCGRGRLQSAATVYQGKVGYFFVSNVEFHGAKRDCILFSTTEGTSHDIVVTSERELSKVQK
jgi:hypothetical protein